MTEMSSSGLQPSSGPILATASLSAVLCGPSTMLSLTKTQGIPPQDLDHYRAEIKGLYVDENKTLKEVMSIMQNKHSLHGTVKMYKKRIRKWRLDKNNKEHEIAILLRKKNERDAIGKATSFRIRGRDIDMNEVLRYCRRKGKKFSLPSISPLTPPEMTCWTPRSDGSAMSPSSGGAPTRSRSASPDNTARPDVQVVNRLENMTIGPQDNLDMILSNVPDNEAFLDLDFVDLLLFSQRSPPIPQPIAPPRFLLISESLFANIHSYFRRCLGNGTWILDGDGALVSGRANRAKQRNPGDVIAHCSNAAKFFNRGSLVEGRQAMSTVFALVQVLLTAELPTTLESFFSSITRLDAAGYYDISTMLRRYIGQMADKILPPHHPWRQICHLIGLLDADDFKVPIQQFYNCVVEAFERELGIFHNRAIACRVEAIHSLNTPHNLPAAERQLQELLLELKELCGLSDWRSQYVMVSLGWQLNHQGKYAEAEVVGNSALRHGLDSDDATTIIRRLELIGDSQYHQGNFIGAEANIRATVDVIEKTAGRADPWAVENLVRLERWMREWGRADEANQLKAEIAVLLRPDNDAEAP